MRVGTSAVATTSNLFRGDHPHACGDKTSSGVACTAGVGSSPCVWGQVTFAVRINSLTRIIPMRVGTRLSLDFAKRT